MNTTSQANLPCATFLGGNDTEESNSIIVNLGIKYLQWRDTTLRNDTKYVCIFCDVLQVAKWNELDTFTHGWLSGRNTGIISSTNLQNADPNGSFFKLEYVVSLKFEHCDSCNICRWVTRLLGMEMEYPRMLTSQIAVCRCSEFYELSHLTNCLLA